MKSAVLPVTVVLLLCFSLTYAQDTQAPQAVMDVWRTLSQPCEEDPDGGQGREEAGGMPEGYADRICDTPQNLTGPILVAAEYSSPFRPAIVWDGHAYGMAWMASIGSGVEIYFARVAADGTVLIPMTRASVSSGIVYRPAIAWSGSQYAIAWDDTRGTNYEVFLALLDASGAKIGSDIAVTTDDSFNSYRPSITWNGSGYGVAWADNRDGQYEMYFALLDATGTKTTGDLPITSDDTFVSDIPSLVWTGSEYGLAWQDLRDGANPEIYFNRISAAGAPLIADYRVTNDAASSQVPVLAWAGTQYGVAWYDSRTTVQDVYFARISVLGVKIGSDLQVTSDPATSAIPSLVWTGAEYGVTWEDNRDAGEYEVYFQRITSAGAKVGSEMRLTVDGAPSRYPVLAFGTLGYGLLYALDDVDKAVFYGLGCHADTTPPSCPANLTITGNSSYGISLLWSAGVDLQTEVAYHRIYRDGSLLAITTANTYTDFPRPAGTPSYTVTAVNANSWESSGCAVVTAPVPEGECGDTLTGIATLTTDAYTGAGTPSISWDGAGYGVAWCEYLSGYFEIYFARVSSDGAVIVPKRRITTATGVSAYPSLAWTGSEYGLAWADNRDGHYQVYFILLAQDGTPGTGAAPFPHATSVQQYPSLIWTGAQYGLAWQDDRDAAGYFEIYFGRLNSTGAPVVATPLRVTTKVNLQSGNPSLGWTGTEYGIAWDDNRDGNYEIYFRRVSASGALIAGSEARITSDSSPSYRPSLAWTGTEYGVSWYDNRSGNYDIFFARISPGSVKIGSDIQLTSTTSNAYWPWLVWTGSEYFVTWYDFVLLQGYWILGLSLDVQGTPVGEIRQYTPAGADNVTPRVAVGGHGMGLAYFADLAANEIRFIGLGCGAEDTTAPPCPSSPAETTRTSTSVTLGWGPSYEAESDFGHYAIYKDGVEYAATLATTYTDASFDPAAGPIYQVLATNAAGYASVGCPAVDTSDHIQPSCVGGLMATVSAGNVTLNWVQAWDDKSGVKEYRVYRNGALRSTIPVGTNTFSEAVATGSTYNYVVETADYAGNTNSSCTTCSVWVYGGALMLFLTKNADTVNADLDWNDVGITEYVVYRSMSPQVGYEHERVPLSETRDMVLQDGVQLWFYYIQQRE